MHLLQAYKANVICPNKHQSDPEKFYNNRLLESETYIGGHVECLESGVFRSDIPSSFTLEPSAYQVCCFYLKLLYWWLALLFIINMPYNLLTIFICLVIISSNYSYFLCKIRKSFVCMPKRVDHWNRHENHNSNSLYFCNFIMILFIFLKICLTNHEVAWFQQLINNLDRDLQYAVTVEGKMDLESVSNYNEVKNAIMEKVLILIFVWSNFCVFTYVLL